MDEAAKLNSATATNAEAGPLGASLSEHLEKTVEGYKGNEDKDTGPDKGDDNVDNEPKLDENGEPIVSEKEDGGDEDKSDVEGKEKVDDKDKAAEDKDKDKSDDDKDKAGDKAADDKEPEPGKPVPYDRFTEVVEAKNSFKRQLDEIQPVVDNYKNITNFCDQHNITPDQFNKVLEVQALLNTNPEEALKRILPIVEHLQGYTGNKLPSDLQKRVDDGKMELDDAREMAKLRAQLRHGEGMTKLSAEQKARQETQRFQQECTREAQTWEKQKRTSDPDYAPKKKESDPDGKWEDVRDKYLALLNQVDARGQQLNPVASSSEMVKLMQRAYDAVNQKWTKITSNKPKTRKPLSSNGAPDSGTATIEGAKSMKDAIHIALANRSR